eukprot:10983115-Alexandrium_andersonii.AAC.1
MQSRSRHWAELELRGPTKDLTVGYRSFLGSARSAPSRALNPDGLTEALFGGGVRLSLIHI